MFMCAFVCICARALEYFVANKFQWYDREIDMFINCVRSKITNISSGSGSDGNNNNNSTYMHTLTRKHSLRLPTRHLTGIIMLFLFFHTQFTYMKIIHIHTKHKRSLIRQTVSNLQHLHGG